MKGNVKTLPQSEEIANKITKNETEIEKLKNEIEGLTNEIKELKSNPLYKTEVNIFTIKLGKI